ncbi:ABC transporter permease subunit [Actinocorallia lasiicapitis]
MTALLEAERRAPGFGDAVAAEWTKICTVRSTYWTILASLLVSIGVSAALAAAITVTWDRTPAREKALFDPASAGMIGINLGVLILAVLGVLVITAEYSTGLIRTSLTAVPRRGRLLTAKALVLTVIAFAVGQLSAFTSFLVSQALFSAERIDASITDPGMFRAVFGGGVYLTLVTLLAFGVGVLLRHTAAAITVVVAVMFVLPILTVIIPGSLGDTITRFIPSNSGAAITIVHQSPTYLSPAAGLTVFSCYLLATLIPAYLLFHHRDA